MRAAALRFSSHLPLALGGASENDIKANARRDHLREVSSKVATSLTSTEGAALKVFICVRNCLDEKYLDAILAHMGVDHESITPDILLDRMRSSPRSLGIVYCVGDYREAAHDLKQDPDLRECPLLIYSSYATVLSADTFGGEANATFSLRYPFNIFDVEDAINRHR